MSSVKRNEGSNAQALAAEAARRAAAQARAEAARAAAAAKAAASAAAKLKDGFAAAAGLSASAGAKAAAKLAPVAAQAKAELGKVGEVFAKASAVLAPAAAGLAAGIGAEAKALAAEPARAFGPFSFDVGALADRARGLVDSVRDTASQGVDLLRQGAEKLSDLAGGLDAAKERAIDELRAQTVDGPIDALNSEGDSVKVNLAGELMIPTPIPDLKAKGVGDLSAEIKRDADDGYTITTEANALLGASVGVEDPAAGNSASGDALVGGGGKVEFKVKPVLDANGNVDHVATKAKAKELTEALARQALVAAAGPVTQPMANAVVGPTAEQLALIKESFQAMEVKGSSAVALAAKLNLPGMVTLDASGKVQQDLTIRIEKGDKGLVVSTKSSLAGEADVQGDGPMSTVNLGANGKAKVELEQRFEFPGIHSLSDVIEKGSTVKPEVKTTLTLSTDAQVGGGTGLGGETGVADGKLKDQRRVGVTTEVKLEVGDNPGLIREIAAEALKGNLADAAKKAGDATSIELKTTVYTERSRTVGGNLKNETIGGIGTKAEVLERDVISAPPPRKTTASEVAGEVQRQLEEAQRRSQQRPRGPVLLRA